MRYELRSGRASEPFGSVVSGKTHARNAAFVSFVLQPSGPAQSRARCASSDDPLRAAQSRKSAAARRAVRYAEMFLATVGVLVALCIALTVHVWLQELELCTCEDGEVSARRLEGTATSQKKEAPHSISWLRAKRRENS